jgi:hypothetical protein
MNAFFAERKIRRNIVRCGVSCKVIHFFKTLVPVLLLVPFLVAFEPQEGKSNPRKVEKMREKKEKEAKRKYEKDLKQHMNNQSKQTKAMMKRARKNSQKNSPVKPASGKKCQ